MVIGGQAVLLYGEPRLTRDIDITLGLDPGGLKEVLAAAKELSLKPIPEDLKAFVKKTFVLPAMDESTGIRVDFIFSFTPYEREAIERARKVKVAGEDVSFAAPEDVVIHKIFAGRPRDLEDARTIMVKNATLDAGYIRRHLKAFDAAAEKKVFLKAFEKILKETRG